MKLSDGFGGFIKCADLEGEDLTLTIDQIEKEEVGADKEVKWVVRWKQDGVKPLVLNKTNANAIEHIYPDVEAEDMGGKKITLYPSTTEFGADIVDCIRIRIPKKGAKPAASASAEEMADAF